MTFEHGEVGANLSGFAQEGSHRTEDRATTLISVVLCTRGRPLALARCVDSLGALDDPNHEVIVVDNHREPTIAAPNDERMRVVHEGRAGLDFARNRGIAEARGDLIAYVDDDCEVGPSWLKALRAAFEDPNVACVTGRVLPASVDRPSQRWFERLMSFDRGAEPRRIKMPPGSYISPSDAGSLGTGCNMAFRKEVFDRIGSFDEALDMGTPVGGGGDLDMFARVLSAGGELAYAPEAIVWHHHRETLKGLAWQLFGYGVSAGALTLKYMRLVPGSQRPALRSQWDFLRFISRGISRYPRGRRLLGLAFVVLVVLGDLCGPLAYIWARRRSRRLRSA